MNIKAIMCDMDGTLLTDTGIVSPVTLEAIRKVREQGILFGICTGRAIDNILFLLKELGISDYVDCIVGTGGGEIYDKATNTRESSFPLDGELIKEVVSHYEDMDLNFAIPYKGAFYAPKDDRHIRLLSTKDHVEYIVCDYNEFLQEPKPKLILITDAENMPAVVERSKTFHNDQYKSASLVTTSILYEYMDPRISKSYGLKQLMGLKGISLDELCTFGDADNDYDMTMTAGIGVVMANGSEKTKSVADYITDDNNHDGIGNFINTYILKENA